MSDALESMNAAFDVMGDAVAEATRTATPVLVQTWTQPAGQGARCDVQLTIPNRAGDGSAIEPTPVVASRPIYYPGGGGWTIHYPLQVGDAALGVCLDRNSDAWSVNRVPGTPSHALIERYHDESDMVVFPMLDRPVLPSPAPGLTTDFVITHSTAGVIIRLGVDGMVTITASPTASIIVDPAGNVKLGGSAATLGVARLTDTTAANTTMTAWMAGVQTVTTAAAAFLGISPPVFPSDFGIIDQASTKVLSE
jgi:hypothetical protein